MTNDVVTLRPLRRWIFATVMLTVSALAALCAEPGQDAETKIVIWGICLCAAAFGLGSLFHNARRFGFHIGPEGIRIRTAGLSRLIGWHEFTSVTLSEGHDGDVLTAVMAPGITLPYSLRDMANDLEPVQYVLLELREIRDTSLTVAEALERHGGWRFTDARVDPLGSAEFSTRRHGWPKEEIDDLVQRSHEAMESGDFRRKVALRAEIVNVRNSLPVVRRGYDREAAGPYLDALIAELARPESRYRASVED